MVVIYDRLVSGVKGSLVESIDCSHNKITLDSSCPT
jgi:hypothetical protein